MIRKVSWKSVALPTEHGGWGFTLEPILLGLAVGPSLPGAWLGLGALGGFLARHPLKLLLSDLRRGKRFPRTLQAAQVLAVYGVIAILAASVAFFTAEGPFWPALAAAVPLGLIHLAADLRGEARALVPELAGALALACLAPAIVLASGWDVSMALGLWLVLAARSVASIPYVRYQVLRTRALKAGGSQPPGWPAALGWWTGFNGLLVAAARGLVPWLSCAALLVMGVRLVSGHRADPPPARVLGWREIGYGTLTVVLTAVGFALGI